MMSTCDLDALLIGARVAGAGHHHGDCRAALEPQGGVGGQRALQRVQQHLVQVTLQQGQQDLGPGDTKQPPFVCGYD